MSDEEQQNSKEAAGAPKKKPVALFAILGVVVVLGLGAAAVFVAGPAFGLGGTPAKEKKPKAKSVKAAEEPSIEESSDTVGVKSKVSKFDPLVVDVRDAEGMMHHLKLNIVIEYPETLEEEFATLQPRAREALIMYLRSLTFEQATDPGAFRKIRDEVVRRVRKSFGEFPARHVLITDFVAQ